MLSIAEICTNDGQIPGLPKNPRFIRDARFAKLKKSITDFPEMLELREVVVFPFEGTYVCIGGNMRYLACVDLGYKEIPAKVLPADFPIEKLREFAIKDNVPFGEDDVDVLANEWTDFPLEDWGIELPSIDEFSPNLEPTADTRKISAEDIVKTKAELDEHYAESRHEYLEVICPHCTETFFLNQK
ncbi:hypothetical protein BH10ACI2_BH10ACI2_04150 [soil metagenome]